MKINLKKKVGEKKVMIGFKVYESDKVAFDKYCESTGYNTTNLLRSFVNNILDKKITIGDK